MDEFINQLRDDHRDFNQGNLDDKIKKFQPIEFFKKWYKEAYEKDCPSPNAMVVSTVNKASFPSSRVVYLKELDADGFVFYTNYESQKGQDILQNPHVSLLFFWESLDRQVKIEGIAEKVEDEISDKYFNSRPRASKIGAWASKQSQIIPNRKHLEEQLAAFEKEFKGKEVPRPPYWGGYRIRPLYIEFWQGRPSRLHDRICFERKDILAQDWEVVRKNP